MEKLYYENPYEKEFTTDIIDVIEKDNNFHVLLGKTYFYPEGGGQPSDMGYIESSPVIYVYEEEGNIYHVVERKPSKFKKVKCSIDWERRYDHMQQHLGQHILSASLIESFDANTIGFHLGKDSSTIDIDKLISDVDFKEAERLANEIVLSNISVEMLYPTDSELRKLPLRKIPPQTSEQIRLVKVGDVDINPCCGTHPNSTIEVQLIKIIRWEKYKSGMRVEFLCGGRAILDYFKKHESVKEISKCLSCNEDNILSEIERITYEARASHSEVRALKDEVAGYVVENTLSNSEAINDIKVIKEIYTDGDLKHANTLASKLVAYPNVVTLFGVVSGDKAHLLFMCSKDLKKVSMNILLKDAITLIDGKGGGTDFSAQGGGRNNNNLESCLEYAYNKVRNTILSKS